MKRVLKIVGLANVLALLAPVGILSQCLAQETHVTREGGAWGQEITGSLAAGSFASTRIGLKRKPSNDATPP